MKRTAFLAVFVVLSITPLVAESPALKINLLADGLRLGWRSKPMDLGSAKIHPGYRLQTSVDLSTWTDLEELYSAGGAQDPTDFQIGVNRDDGAGFYRLTEVLSAADVDLSSVDLTGSDLRQWDLRASDLSGAILIDADLRGVDLRGADLRGADLTGALLDGALTEATNFVTSKGYAGAPVIEPEPTIEDPFFDDFLGDVAAPAADGLFAEGAGGAARFESDNLGFAVGGSKDINNFRDNLEQNYLPLVTDVVYEGLFFDYFFDRGQSEPCEQLFCPSFSQAIATDPLSQKPEPYLSVGLSSNISAADFQRKQLNVVVVLDISGSMGSSFNRYYYDDVGNQQELSDDERTKSKMDVAKEAVVTLLDQLKPDDQLGIVLFSSSAKVFLDLTRVGDMDSEVLSQQILNISKGGGTNMSAGYLMGTRLYDELLESDAREIENRIIFLTDAQPNRGVLDENGLLAMTERNAANRLHTSFIGIGLDFNTNLIEPITKVRGANYFSVHSPEQFRDRMDTGFDFMVTPLVFGLEMTLESDNYEIAAVYGTPEADISTGSLLKVNTLFPSESKGGETRGGLILLKLRPKNVDQELNDGALDLSVVYEDREGTIHRSSEKVEITTKQVVNDYPSTGIRKGILLARYAELLRNWIFDERLSYRLVLPCDPFVSFEDGIVLPPIEEQIEPRLGTWERQSVSLFVARPYRRLFGEFLEHFRQEADALDDSTLDQEIEILTKLSQFGSFQTD